VPSGPSAEERRSLTLLEFPRLLDAVAAHCATARAAAELRRSQPLHDEASVNELWSWVGELSTHLANGEDLPLGGIVDLEALVGEEREIPGPLEASELAAVGAACRELAGLLDHVLSRPRALPRCHELLREQPSPGAVGRHIEGALENDGRIKDEASPRLRGLRDAVVQARSRLRSLAQEEMNRAVRQGWTSSGELVLRGDRYCIPLKSGRLHRLQGVIHDRSSTGHTLFVEPLPVVESANRLQEVRLAVEEEEARILASLNREVAAIAPQLLELYRRAVRLDALRSRARWGLQNDGRPPRLPVERGSAVRLEGFRHPLLQMSLEGAGRRPQLVPLDLSLEAADRVVLISGPNAGGKTVVLKSVGLAACMVQTGIPLPSSSPVSLPLFDHIFLELGDDQSLADALSHFSAHLTHLQAIHDQCTEDSLVLLDEIGGGTDPLEGVALARAYLEDLSGRVRLVLATTHYGQLKALVHELEGFRNAGMAFDAEDLRPLFRLQLDAPGASRALEIAARLGFDAAILERARRLVGSESLRLNRVLAEMEAQREALRKAREEAENEWQQGRTHRLEYERRARDLRQRRREILDRAEAEAEAIVRRGRARVESLLEEIRRAGESAEAVERARRAREEIDRRVRELERRQRERRTARRGHAPARIEVGAQVRHARLGLVATIVEVQGERVILEARGRRILAAVDELTAPDGPVETPPGPPTTSAASAQTGGRFPGGGIRLPAVDAHEAVSRVDVRGLDVEEAWVAVDKALDRCLLAGTHRLEVIHGKGTGTLRRELRTRLQRDERVGRVRPALAHEGDEGLTVVEMPE